MKHLFIGFFPVSALPSVAIGRGEGFIIGNTSSDPAVMGHWLLFFIKKNNSGVIFIDSFGLEPSIYGGNVAKFCSLYDNDIIATLPPCNILTRWFADVIVCMSDFICVKDLKLKG